MTESLAEFLQNKFDVGELNHFLLYAVGSKIDQTQDCTVIITQSSNCDDLDMDCVHADRVETEILLQPKQIIAPTKEFSDNCYPSLFQ